MKELIGNGNGRQGKQRRERAMQLWQDCCLDDDIYIH